MVAPGVSITVVIPLAGGMNIRHAGAAKTGDFRRFGRRRHANQLFWHVFNLLAG
jgi:hypothetical protein